MKTKHLLLLIALFAVLPSFSQGWQNPMTLGNQEGMGIGDPYILKYRGVYYLYSSSYQQIHCWTSRDLVTWTNAKIVCTDAVADNAYAPEVKYWNGRFYMCTSPAGNGHYILTSDSPMGPFTHVTENIGRLIDGSFFIDDDGSWYFYHADGGGIKGNKMPTRMSFGDDQNLNACMNGQWTEGPSVFKRNGIYYLVYTGNHVLTNGYRIDYAVNTEGPIATYTPQSEQNPILIDTESANHFGLGHGSPIVGPDLDSYYYCYHNLNRLTGGATNRSYNFDRIGWNGDKLMLYGPTVWKQDAPAIADNDYLDGTAISASWTMPDGGEWAMVDNDHLSQTLTDKSYRAVFAPAYDNYTAEFTVRAASDVNSGRCGAICSYRDAQNYTKLLLDASSRKFIVVDVTNGAENELKSVRMGSDFDVKSWHALRVEKSGTEMRLYVDGMRKAVIETVAEGGCVGYVTDNCKADFSYIAISKYVDGNGIYDVNIPVPGIVAAAHYAETSEGVADEDYSLGWGKCSVVPLNAGKSVSYHLNIQAKYNYNIGLRYRSTKASHVRILFEGNVVADNVELPSTNNAWRVVTVKDVDFISGKRNLTVEMIDGSATLYELNIRRGVKAPVVLSDDFEAGISKDWKYKEGTWTAVDGQVKTPTYGKMLIGTVTQGWLTDYTVECDIKYTMNINAGILFRTTNPSTGGANDSPSQGTDFVQGYFFTLGSNGATLGKHNYGWTTLASKTGTYTTNRSYHLKVDVEGDTFKCYVDGKLVINYTDTTPFIEGRAGIRTHNCTAYVDNFVVTPVVTDTGIDDPAPIIYKRDEAIYNLNGQRLDNMQKGVNIVGGRKVVKP